MKEIRLPNQRTVEDIFAHRTSRRGVLRLATGGAAAAVLAALGSGCGEDLENPFIRVKAAERRVDHTVQMGEVEPIPEEAKRKKPQDLFSEDMLPRLGVPGKNGTLRQWVEDVDLAFGLDGGRPYSGRTIIISRYISRYNYYSSSWWYAGYLDEGVQYSFDLEKGKAKVYKGKGSQEEADRLLKNFSGMLVDAFNSLIKSNAQYRVSYKLARSVTRAEATQIASR